jgi:hypothetical protein
MFELVGAIGLTSAYALLVGVLVSCSAARRQAKVAALLAAMLWGCIIVILAATGTFLPGATGPFPGPVLAFLVFLVLLFAGWFTLPRFRNSLLSIPIWALVGLNITRIAGVFFLMLTEAGRLSSPFGPSAGWGDVTVGILAIPLAAFFAMDVRYPPVLIRIWNALGVLDLVVAILLGALSATGTPFRVFVEGPGTAAIGELPWIMIPAMLVPLYFLIHATIEVKVRSAERTHRIKQNPAA